MSYIPEELRFTNQQELDTFLARPDEKRDLKGVVDDLLAVEYFYNAKDNEERCLEDMVNDIMRKLYKSADTWGTERPTCNTCHPIYRLVSSDAPTREVIQAFGWGHLITYGL